MSGGLGSLLGPTGGYLFGFMPTAFIIGYFLEKTSFTVKNAIIANVIGMFVALSFGTVWLMFVANLTWTASICRWICTLYHCRPFKSKYCGMGWYCR